MPRFLTTDMAEVLRVFPSHTSVRIPYEDAEWILRSSDALESPSFREAREQRPQDPLLREIRNRIGNETLQRIRRPTPPTPGRHDEFLFVFEENPSGQTRTEITLGFALITP